MQLIPFLKSIADAIRGKEGSTATIPAADFASRITNLPSGEDEIDGLVEGTLTEFVNDRVTKIGDGCFMESSIQKIVCLNAKTVGRRAFYHCGQLSYVRLPSVTEIDSSAFWNCLHIASFKFQGLKAIRANAFENCRSMKTFDMYGQSFPADTGSVIEANAFNFCSSLVSLIIRSEEYDDGTGVKRGVGLDSAGVFNGTPIAEGTGYIYVPRSFVDTYKTAENWSIYASQIRALEDYTVDGTTTGELDPNKI